MVRLLVLMVIMCFSASQLFANGTATPVPPPTIIAAFGDSLFAGYGLAPEDAFPAQLERRLKADGYHVTVINDGVDGDTTADGVSRVQKIVDQKPDVVLLELGGNDLLQGVQPDDIEKNMDTIVLALQKSHVKIFILGQKAPLNMGNYASAYNRLFPKVASMYGTGLYPAFPDSVYGNPALMQPDGVHPTAEGVAVLVTNSYPMIKTALRK